MNNERTGQHATTTDWENVGALVKADPQFNGMGTLLREAVLSVPAGAAVAVSYALTGNPSAEPVSDIVSNTIKVDGAPVAHDRSGVVKDGRGRRHGSDQSSRVPMPAAAGSRPAIDGLHRHPAADRRRAKTCRSGPAKCHRNTEIGVSRRDARDHRRDVPGGRLRLLTYFSDVPGFNARFGKQHNPLDLQGFSGHSPKSFVIIRS